MTLPLFAYGTLLAGAKHRISAHLREMSRPMGHATFQGRLYIVTDPDDPTNAYPAALPSADPADVVHGELYQITGDAERLYKLLDRFEGCWPDWPQPYEYLRREISVVRDGGETIQATAYLYTWDVSRARHVPAGRYRGELGDVR